MAAVTRPSTSPLRVPFVADRGARNRDTGTCVVPCRREAALGSDTPRTRGKLVVWLGPWEQFCRQPENSSISKFYKYAGTGFRLVDCGNRAGAAPGIPRPPSLSAPARPRAGAVFFGPTRAARRGGVFPAKLGAGPLAALMDAASYWSAFYLGISAPLVYDRLARGLQPETPTIPQRDAANTL